jgi:hypothetical protein
MGAQAAASSADQHYQQQQQQSAACKLEPLALASAAALQPEPYHSTSTLQQQQHAAAAAAAMDHDALGVDVDDEDDDLDLSMLPEQLGEQLPEDFVPTPHQSSGWPSMEATLGGLDMPAAAADATLIGSACSAAGCNADSLAAAVQEEEAAQQQQQQMAFKSSPFLLPGASGVAPGSPLAAAAAFQSMRSRDSSSASLCEAALLHRGSCNNSSMSNSSLAKSCSMPIRMSNARPDTVRLSGPTGMTCFSAQESSSLSGLPGFASMPMNMSNNMSANMSCGSLSTMHGGGSAAATAAAYDPAAAAAAAVVAQQEEDRVDAELQQLLSQWTPDDSAAPAPAAAAPALSHQAMSAPAGFGGFSQQLSCSFPQQQLSMPLSMPGQQLDMSLGGCGSSTAMSGAAAGFVGFAAPQQQQQAPSQLAWKPAFAPSAPTNSSSSGALSVTVPISVPAAGSALASGLQCGSPFTSCSTMQGSTATAPVQIAYPAGRQPRARKGKGSSSKAAQQQAKKQQQQQQLTMQLQVPASALPAAVPPGARVVLHLKPNQQQQLMAVVDRLVQQRLAQTYEAGYRAAAANMGAGSMPPPAPVPPHQVQQGQLQMSVGTSSAQMGDPRGGIAGSVGIGSMSCSLPGRPTASQGFGQQLFPAQAGAAEAAIAAPQMVMMPNVGGGGGVPCGVELAGQSQQLLLQGMPRQSQLVDDILPSMQDLLTDCCE